MHAAYNIHACALLLVSMFNCRFPHRNRFFFTIFVSEVSPKNSKNVSFVVTGLVKAVLKKIQSLGFVGGVL